MNLDRNTMIAGGVAAAGVLAGAGHWAFGTGTGASNGDEIAQVTADCKPIETFEVTEADYTLGKADAPITFIEYASMTCPGCAYFSNEILPKLKENYVEKGYVRYVFREYPIDRVALTASVVGRCLQKDAYIPYVELMYSELMTWGRSQDPRGALKEMARRAGMSGEEFEKCLSTDTDAKRVLAVQAKAMKDYCVTSTPTFVLNGKVISGSEWPALDEKLREAAKAKGVTIPAAATDAAAPAEGAATAPAEGTAAPAADGAASTPTDGAATPAEPVTAPPAP